MTWFEREIGLLTENTHLKQQIAEQVEEQPILSAQFLLCPVFPALTVYHLRFVKTIDALHTSRLCSLLMPVIRLP